MCPSIPHSSAGCSATALLINCLLPLAAAAAGAPGTQGAWAACTLPCLPCLRAHSPCPTRGLEAPWELAPILDPCLARLHHRGGICVRLGRGLAGPGLG